MSVPSNNRRKSSDISSLGKTNAGNKSKETKSGAHGKSDAYEQMDTMKKSDFPVFTNGHRKSDAEKSLHGDPQEKVVGEPYVHEYKEFAGVTVIVRAINNPKAFGNLDGQGKHGSRRKSEFQHSHLHLQDKSEHGDKSDHAGSTYPVFEAKSDTSANNFTATGSLSFDWLKFKQDYNKHYKSAAEENERKQIFLENVNRIRTFERTHRNATFKLGINHMTDRRIEELVSSKKFHLQSTSIDMDSSFEALHFPGSLDWRTKGVISPVKTEGPTEQTEAVVAVEVVESWYAIQTGKLEKGSVARVVDCCPQPNNPLQCIAKLGGICYEADYPDTTGQCIPNKCKPFAHFNVINQLKNLSESTMVAWIQNSPLFIGVDASRASFEFYQSGVYDDRSCSKTTVDHIMQLVGYGKTSSGDLYWICKNSWGVGWGEKGYINILRGQNTCGIATYVMQVA